MKGFLIKVGVSLGTGFIAIFLAYTSGVEWGIGYVCYLMTYFHLAAS